MSLLRPLGHVHLLHGFVASGKTTLARKLESELPAIRFSPDEWMSVLYGSNPPAEEFANLYSRVVSLMESVWLSAVKSGSNVILDFGFWKRADRDAIQKRLTSLGMPFTLYGMRCDRNVALERCRARNDKLIGSLLIDDAAFKLFESRFEELEMDEKYVLVDTNQG